jgi:acetyltransferase-like isoleucine patch superfamily enzyme
VLKRALKFVVNAAALALTLPLAVITGFGRSEFMFQMYSQMMAVIPGIPGDYLRVAFYRLTLTRCSLDSRVSFGTIFGQSSVTIERGVYIGAYCVIGACSIGARSQIASHVQILSGNRQHRRDDSGQIQGTEEGNLVPVKIGADCWIGASSVIMADVGSGSTIGAGAVVPRAVPDGVVAVGNPAQVIKRAGV